MNSKYPNRPVRIIVPLPQGGPADILARIVGQKLAAMWGQEVIVENLVGDETIIGTKTVAKAVPDGHTLLMVPSQFTVHPRRRTDLPYDVVKDFAPVILMALGPNVLVVHPSVPASSVQELASLAKSRPGELKCASGGKGSTTYRAAELFKAMAGIDFVHLPYHGAATATNAVLDGTADMLFSVMAPTIPYVQANKLRALAVTGPSRSLIIPDVPTMKEAGYPGYELTTWQGLLAPAGTPSRIITKLNTDVGNVLRTLDVQQHLRVQGFELAGDTPGEFAARIKMELETTG